jgi:DNA-binding response OmpR family regulator
MNTSPKVLLVDDNEDLLDVLHEGLTNQGFIVEVATDGAAGLERFFEMRPDCVVIDVKMPQINGYQLVRALRGDPDSASVPLLILTALPQDAERFKGLASGVDFFLLKPQTPTEIAEQIRRAMQISEAERQRRYLHLAEEEQP